MERQLDDLKTNVKRGSNQGAKNAAENVAQTKEELECGAFLLCETLLSLGNRDVLEQRTTLIELLVNHRVDANATVRRSDKRLSPLLWATQPRRNAMVEALLKQGADTNYADP